MQTLPAGGEGGDGRLVLNGSWSDEHAGEPVSDQSLQVLHHHHQDASRFREEELSCRVGWAWQIGDERVKGRGWINMVGRVQRWQTQPLHTDHCRQTHVRPRPEGVHLLWPHSGTGGSGVQDGSRLATLL